MHALKHLDAKKLEKFMGEKRKHDTHPWSKHAVVYHIYPRSFYDTTGNGIGDLKGIIKNLDYLNDGTENSLGVDAVWLSPIYCSPMVDFGYDITDFKNIDPLFGTLKDFERLVREVHKRKMKLIMDFVPNHTSIKHPWFQESRKNKNNKKADWYVWKDPKENGDPPNNWLSVFGGSAWTYDEKRKQYYLHNFLEEQPDLNWRNREVKDEMLSVLTFWLDCGVDGFRTDAAYHLIEDETFADEKPNPNYRESIDDPYNAQLHIRSQGNKETLDSLSSFCNVLGAKERDLFMVSEAYLDIPGMNILYQACTEGIHAPLNFNFIGREWSAKSFKKFVDEFEISLKEDDVPTYVLGNHDRHRIASRIGKAQARVAALLTFTLRGMPFIYYGDELGMEDILIPEEKQLDPWGKRVPGFGFGRDPERSPMQWNDDTNAGFTKGTPWLPVGKDYRQVNVEVESYRKDSMLNFYKKLIKVRKNSNALLIGKYIPIPLIANKSVFGFIREYSNQKIFIAINFTDKEITCDTRLTSNKKLKIKNPKAISVCNSVCDMYDQAINLQKLHLRPYEGYIIELM